MPPNSFSECVFVNCPFDEEYEPILQAILFCISYLGFSPRIATESGNSAELRLQRIRDLIESSKYSIHDLSRCQSAEVGELFRLNMPFELGIDYGCREFYGHGRADKRILILEEKTFRYQAAISDLAGCDIQSHGGKFEVALRKVRNWLNGEAAMRADGASRILDAYYDFQEWHYKEQLAKGFSEEDIQDYPTIELLQAMLDWFARGRPI